MVSQERVRLPVRCTSTKDLSRTGKAGELKKPSHDYDEDDYDEFDIHDVFDDDMSFYTEKSTNLIYEAKFFETFIIVRPASPAFYSAIRKLAYGEFADEFTDFWGDREQVRSYLDNSHEGIIIV